MARAAASSCCCLALLLQLASPASAQLFRAPDAYFSSAATATYGDITAPTAASNAARNFYEVGAAVKDAVFPSLISRTGVGVPTPEEQRAFAGVSGPGCGA